MNESVNAFYHDFLQEILGRAEVNKNFSDSVFAETVAGKMIEAGELDAFDYCHFKGHGIRVDGYSFVDDEGLINLFVSEFRDSSIPEGLTRTDALSIFKRLESFFAKSLQSKFHEAMEESSDGFRLAHDIYSRRGDFSKVRFYLLTDAVLSSRVQEIENRNIEGYECSYSIWDLSRLHRLEASGKGREDIVIDLTEFNGDGLSCLPAHLHTSNYQSYLIVVPAGVLAALYDRYGQRLLEQNVRTFLQFRGGVNKGIRNTILNDPEMFFAYNNGVTATAESLIIDENQSVPKITKMNNLQIVNGGQTTAAIFGAKAKDNAKLDKIFVQMKLSIVDPERSEEIVPKISEYANSQNRINAADFFANHPFHVRIEEISRRLWAPSQEGSQLEMHWFYERARGQYANAQALLTPAKKKEFLLHNPRNQMFTKTDLAKFENTWSQRPHTVSLGAQKNFAQFASEVGNLWGKDGKGFNELYFKQLVVKAILFRSTEKLVMKQPWYAGGYRANIVTYSLALLSRLISESGNSLDFSQIWKRQKLNAIEEAQIEQIAQVVNEIIQETPANITNVTEWCKKQGCWDRVKAADLALNRDFKRSLVNKDEAKIDQKDAEKIQSIDNGIVAQKKVLSFCEKGIWKDLQKWGRDNQLLTDKDEGLLSVAIAFPNKLPSEKQSISLMRTLHRMQEEGYSARL